MIRLATMKSRMPYNWTTYFGLWEMNSYLLIQRPL